MMKLAPSILSADFSKLGEEVKLIEKYGADYVHIDVMDGHFVPNITIGPLVVKSLRKLSNLVFDVHLMIEDPDKYIEQFAKAGSDIITVHAEACIHLNRTINLIKSFGKKAGVAINPATHLNVLDYVLDDIDMILIMSVNPGFGGQKFIDSSIKKINEIKKKIDAERLSIDIEVDGGINLNNVDDVIKAGANVIVAGSAIFESENIKDTIDRFKRFGEKYEKGCCF
ncbi:Ribulose-phosphate 3-epimerase [Caloramator mitchellensis]|uniref:Ribulose-phosphate 3-epimerase n=1 Tax=Caloramator mitchellensis TaxID=908809 RepID=A0A0R3K0L7_CALMK|nr:ribulose-phosphate 3-epimerase [Caloramator mitchellensis]KRQ86932.1 Ribulose-phosphate 3-epimerase [Caloramator mitchellensis]